MVSIHTPTRRATSLLSQLKAGIYISIRTPMRRVTPGHLHQIRLYIISIHAPARGATVSG